MSVIFGLPNSDQERPERFSYFISFQALEMLYHLVTLLRSIETLMDDELKNFY